jgi:NDP-sugar pyrophosphorylase family protein
MRPFTETIPKALIPVCGKPFVDHQLSWLARHGVTHAVFCIGYRGEMLRDHVGDGTRHGLHVTYVDEGKDLRGTAGAVRLAIDAGAVEDSFLLTYGDSYLPVDFAAAYQAFREQDAPALMAVMRNDGKWDTSNVLLEGGKVLYDKRRRDPETAQRMRHIDFGLSAWTSGVFLERVPAGRVADLADLQHALSVEGRLAAWEVTTRFYEAGSPGGLRDLESHLSGDDVKAGP